MKQQDVVDMEFVTVLTFPRGIAVAIAYTTQDNTIWNKWVSVKINAIELEIIRYRYWEDVVLR